MTLPRPAKKGEMVALDLEMFGQDVKRLHRPHGTFACLSIAYSAEEHYQITDKADLPKALERLKSGMWIFHNALYDLRQLRGLCNTPPVSKVWDTMLVERAMFGGYYNDFSLAGLTRRWLHVYLSKEQQSEFGQAEHMTTEMAEYAIRDAISTLLIAQAQRHQLDESEDQLRSYWEVDEPAIWAFLDLQPVAIDADGWRKLAEENDATGVSIQLDLGFNVKSPKQTIEHVEKMTRVHLQDSTKLSLEQLALGMRSEGYDSAAEFIEKILEARSYRDASSKYGMKWLDEYVEEENLVYPDFKVSGTETSRTSCSSPNVQQIPVRKMPKFRELFVSRHPGGSIIIADQNQQELRFLAWFSGDTVLRKALLDGRDLHQEVADDFGLTRRKGKDINLGLGYGMSAAGLASRVGISIEAAEAGIRKRNARYPLAAIWSSNQKSRGAALGYVTSALGRRMWINPYLEQWERNAINSPIQSSAAEQTKIWLRLIFDEAKARDLPFAVTMLVHDELVADVPKGMVRQYAKLLKETGIESGKMVAPDMEFDVAVAYGPNWGAKA